MSNNETILFIVALFLSVGVGAVSDFLYYSRRINALSDRIDKLVLRIEQLEMERDKLEK